MATLRVRNLLDSVYCALKMRAAQHGRSVKAEARAILVLEFRQGKPIRLGDALAALSRSIKLKNRDAEALDQARKRHQLFP